MNDLDELTRRFFLESNSTQLTRIYQWARSRYAAPWAVFFAVLLRVSASTGPNVQLPAVIGGRRSLNLLCAFVGVSGSGKGISDQVGRLAWPAPILELPIGTGEGIAATYAAVGGPDADADEPVTRAIFSCPEIDILTGIAGRQGATILGTLKAFAMGELLGATNALKANSRKVPAHSYRGCLSLGAQPGHTGIIFDDATGGTPQRFLWAPTTDPHMPADRIGDPAPLDTTIPLWAPGEDGVVEIAYGPDEITETIIGGHLDRQRGTGDALDGHWMLTRCKVAALLAIMHQRSVASAADWELSAMVMTVSDATRQMLTDYAKRAATAKIRQRAVARATGDEFYDKRLLEGVQRSILRALERDGEQAGNELRSKMGKRDRRDMFDQAVSLLLHQRQVVSVEVSRGTRYRLTEVQGEPPVQGAYPQVNEGEPRVQGEPLPATTQPEKAQVTENDAATAPPTASPPGDAVKTPESTLCEICWVQLPTSVKGRVCEDCAEPAPPAGDGGEGVHLVSTTPPGDAAETVPSVPSDAPTQQTPMRRRVVSTAPQIRAAVKRARGDRSAS